MDGCNLTLCSNSTICGNNTLIHKEKALLITYQNSAEPNKVDKTLELKKMDTLCGVFLEPLSIINPTIRIYMKNTVPSFNYVYSVNFKRYYFVTNITSLRDDYWQIDLKCDVLNTYQRQIKMLDGYVARNEYDYNVDIEDKLISYQYNKDVKESDPTYSELEQYKGALFVYNKAAAITGDNKGTILDVNDCTIVSIRTNYLINNKGIFKIICDYTNYSSSSPNNIPQWMVTNSNGDVKYSSDDYSHSGNRITPKFKLNELFTNDNDSVLYLNVQTSKTSEVRIYNNTFIEYPDIIPKWNSAITYINTTDLETNPTHTVVIPPNDYLPKVDTFITSATTRAFTSCIDKDAVANILDEVQKDDALRSFLISITTYPFDLYIDKTIYESHGITLGSKQIVSPQNKNAVYLYNKNSEYYSFRPFKISRKFNDFRDYEPYTKYEIYIPYASWISVQADDVLDNDLQISYVLNYGTSNAVYYLIDITNNKVIASGSAQLGISIPINSSNMYEIENQRKALHNSMILNTVASAVTIGSGIASANPLALSGGVLSGARTISSYTTSSNMLRERSQCVQSSGDFSVYFNKTPRIRITSSIKVNDAGYKELVGKPLNEVRRLGQVFGYTEVVNVHVHGIPNITYNEQEEIKTLLQEGVIF